jgi:selenocysteine-specific translation elongation factor
MDSNFIGLLGSNESGKTSLAEMFGKKGISSDITLYSSNKGAFANVIDPTKYPESFKTLVQTLQLSDSYILCINAEKGIDKNFGEIILTLRSLWNNQDINRGLIAITNSSSIYDNILVEKLKKFLKISNFPEIPIILTDIEKKESIQNVKDILNNQLTNQGPRKTESVESEVEIWLDHVFPVKGVGTVILGKVMNGVVEKGMKLDLLPNNKLVNVKSIQLNDIEEKEAHPGSHVGLAIKGIASDQLYRGCVLYSSDKNGYAIKEKINLALNMNKYASTLEIGSSIHIIIGLDYLTGKIINIKTNSDELKPNNVLHANESGEVTIHLQRNVVAISGRTVIISNLNKMPRVQGSGKIV